MNPITAAYRPSKGLTTFTSLLLGACAFFAMLRLGSGWLDLELFAEYRSSEEMYQEGAWVGAGLRHLAVLLFDNIVWVMTVVCFCVWVVRASKNARALGAQGMQVSPGWAAGWFFVPIANLFMPFKAVSEIWKASGATRDPDPTAWKAEPAGPVVFWWSVWILAGLAAHFNFNFSVNGVPTLDSLRMTTYVQMLAAGLSLVSAFAAFNLVRGIHFRQEHKWSLIQAGAVKAGPGPVADEPGDGGHPFLRQTPAA